MATTPFIRDVPAARALAAWSAACAAAGCPDRVDAVRMGLHEAVGRVTAEPVWATRSSPSYDASAMDGIAVRAADTVGASESTPVLIDAGHYVVVDTGDPLPDGLDAVVMREHVHYDAGRAELRSAIAPYQHVRSIGEDVSAGELLLPVGHRLRAVDVAAAAAAGATDLVVRRAPVVAVLATGDEIRPVGTAPAPGVILDTNSLMLVAQAEAAGCDAWRSDIVPDAPAAIATAVRDATARADLVIVVAGSSAGRDDHTAAIVERLGTLAVHGVAVRPGHPVVLRAVDATPVLGAPRHPVSASPTFDIFALPLVPALEGATPAERPRSRRRRCAHPPPPRRRGPGGPRPRAPPPAPAPASRASTRRQWAWRTGCASGSAVSEASSSRRRCRAARACSRRSCAPMACSSCRRGWGATTPGGPSRAPRCVASARSSARSSRSARTTSYSTWLPRSCGSSTPA